MIWARPLSPDGEAELDPMLARAGLTSAGRAVLFSGLERLAVLTGLDKGSRAQLHTLAGDAVLGGEGDGAVLRWSPRSLQGWRARLPANDDGLGRAFTRLAALDAPLAPFTIGPLTLWPDDAPAVMGVLNVTPDSFSDGGRHLGLDAAVAHAELLVAAGADLLDVGGESTRPGAQPVDVEEELRRVVPVVRALAARLPGVPLSVDTSKSEVARQAVAAGAHLVNDVGGLRDPALLAAVAELGVPACVMHMQGTPRTMQADPRYDDVVGEVLDTLELALRRAEAAGVPRARLLVDPGIGFGKTGEHNLYLLRRLAELRLLGSPVLVGTSRKAFLGALLGGRPAEARAVASAASVAVLRGAAVVRVHDVAQTRDAVRVARAINQARGGGALFAEPGGSLLE